MKKIIITIDGPAASGKEKISKYISKKYKLKHLDSGILYRQLAFYFFTNKIDSEDVNLLTTVASTPVVSPFISILLSAKTFV